MNDREQTPNNAESADDRAKPGWRETVKGNVLMMGLVSLFTDFSSEMMNPILPIFLAGLVGRNDAPFWVGLTAGIAETTAAVLKIFSGRLSDRLGKRKMLVAIGYGLSTVCRPATAMAMNAWHVVALKFGDRVGKGIRTSPRDALIGDSVHASRRGLAFSFHRLMDHTGAVLGPLTVIALLYAWLGYAEWGGITDGGEVSAQEMDAMRWVFAIALIPGIAAMLSLLLKVREIPPGEKDEPDFAGVAEPSAWRRLGGKFYGYLGIVTLFALGNSSDMFLLLYGWSMFEMGLIQVVLLWIALHVSKIVFSIPGGVLSDRFGRRPVIVAGWLVYAGVYVGMAWLGYAAEQDGMAGLQAIFWALLIAYGFYYGMTEGVEKALVADFARSADRGTAFGLYHGAIGLAALPASLLFGVFWAAIGPVTAFGIGAALAGLATVLLIVLLSATSRQQPGGG